MSLTFISGPDLSSGLQTHMSNCRLDTSTSTSHKHLKLKMSKTKCNSQPPPLTKSPGHFLVFPAQSAWETSGALCSSSSSEPTQPTRSVDSIQICHSLHLHHSHHPESCWSSDLSGTDLEVPKRSCHRGKDSSSEAPPLTLGQHSAPSISLTYLEPRDLFRDLGVQLSKLPL